MEPTLRNVCDFLTYRAAHIQGFFWGKSIFFISSEPARMKFHLSKYEHMCVLKVDLYTLDEQ